MHRRKQCTERHDDDDDVFVNKVHTLIIKSNNVI